MKHKPITRMAWTGAAIIDRQGPAGSWRIWMDAADRAVIAEGMTTTAMIELARQINRAVKEARKETS